MIQANQVVRCVKTCFVRLPSTKISLTASAGIWPTHQGKAGASQSRIRSMGLLKKSLKAFVVGPGDVRQKIERFADDYLGPDVGLSAEICLPPQAQQALQFPELSFERA